MAPIKPLNTNFGRVFLVGTASMPRELPSLIPQGEHDGALHVETSWALSRAGLHPYPAL